MYPDLSHLKDHHYGWYYRPSCPPAPETDSEGEKEGHAISSSFHRQCPQCYERCRICHKRGSDEEESHGPFAGRRTCRSSGSDSEDEGHGPWSRHRPCEETCGGPFSSKYCGHCKGPEEEGGFADHEASRCRPCNPDECGGPFSSKYCGHCKGPELKEEESDGHFLDHERRGSNDGHCGGPFSSHYCGRYRPSEGPGCHGNQDGVDGRWGEEGWSPRGRNHVMEGESFQEAIVDLERELGKRILE